MQMNRIIIAVIILAGIGLIIAAFLPNTLQIAAVMGGVGFVCLGLLQIGKEQEKRLVAEKYRQIAEKLEKIEQLGEKLEQPRNTGVAIADVISSGLKYYTEHLSQQKDDKDD